MTTKQQFVDEVRTWVGTPFHHEARVKGAGADCAGVVVGSCANLGIPVKDAEHYPRVPTGGLFERYVNEQTIPASISDISLGDIITFKFLKEMQHIAIVTQVEPTIRIVHAFSQAKRCVENDLDDYWKRRIVSVRRLEVLE